MSSIDAHRDESQDDRPRFTRSARRIAWFLALGQVLQFPAYPMAPVLTRHRARQFATLEGDPVADRLGLLSGTRARFLRSRERHRVTALIGNQARDSALNDAAKGLTRLSPVSQMPWFTNAVASQQQVALSRTNSYVSAALTPATSAVSVGSDTLYAQRITEDPPIDWIQRPGTEPALTSAFLPVSRANGGFHDLGPWRPPVASDKWNPMAPEIIDRSLDNQTETGQGFRAGDEFTSVGINQAASGDGHRSSSLRGSTLHLDGSALGRWAVDHLQRTLSRPATGMTGVDPRATIPRSRVSPF
jgi:hypothetical protein